MIKLTKTRLFPLILWCFATHSMAQNTFKHVEKFSIKPTNATAFGAVNGKECTVEIPNDVVRKDDLLYFEGAPKDKSSGQVDPQVAASVNHVLALTNTSVAVFDKKGKLLKATDINCFTNSVWGIDPKVFYDRDNKYFGFAVHDYESKKEKKPMRFLLSKTDNPLDGWHKYTVPSSDALDGGSIGYGNKWLVYEYPTKKGAAVFVFNAQEAKAGKPITVYKFLTEVGQPIFNQDNGNTYFIRTDADNKKFILSTIGEKNGVPFIQRVWSTDNASEFTEGPPASAQKETASTLSSGDFNPKNAVIQNKSVWIAHAVKDGDYSAVEWFELSVKDGNILQNGLISAEGTHFIHPSIAVNKRGDMAIGFQEVNKNMFVSVRCAHRLAGDEKSSLRMYKEVVEGDSYFKTSDKDETQTWGDYSGTAVDGDGINFWSAQTMMKDKAVKTIIFRLKL